MKILCQRYYQPVIRENAINFTRASDRCQYFSNYPSLTAISLTSMITIFYVGIDLMGELPKAKGKVCGGYGGLLQ